MTHLDAAFLSIAMRADVARADFDRLAAQAEVVGINVDGEPAGAVLIIGNHIHACVLPQYAGRWFSRKAARALNGVIERHGHALTNATTEAGRVFVERLGFKKVGDEYRKDEKWALNH